MATNLVPLDVYQINGRPPGFGEVASKNFAFPTQGFLVQDCTNSPTRSLSTGYDVYSALQAPDGTLYYVRQTVSQIVSLFNA